MKLKRFIAALLVFAMSLSYLPAIPLAQATDNISTESSILKENTSGNIDEIITEDTKSKIETSEPDVTNSTKKEPNLDEITVLTNGVSSNNSFVQMTFPAGSNLTEDSSLSVSEGEPDSDQMWAAMGQYTLLSVLDYLVLDISTKNVSGVNNVTVDIEFNEPYLKALSFSDVHFVEFKDGTSAIPLDSFASVNEDGLVSELSFKLNNFESNTRIVMVTADQPSLSAWKDYSSSYCIGADNYNSHLSGYGIGASGNGRLTYHCYATSDDLRDMNDFAICTNNLLYFKGGTNVAYTNAYGGNDDSSRGDWADLSDSVRASLILLLAYGMDSDSSVSRYTDNYAAYAAIQLVAWEWIRGVDDGYFTECYNSTVQEIAGMLRYYVYSNPDDVDPYTTRVTLVWPDVSNGQSLIALENDVSFYVREGDISVTKAITGSGTKSGWIFELYGSRDNANNRVNRLATAKTNSSGVATFTGLTPGTRYYVREAPASSQTNATTGWTIPTTVLSCTVVGNTTTSAGTITNIGPAKISVTKKIIPNAQSTSTNLSGWIFELYSTENNAKSATNPIKTATTNTSGVAYFDNLNAGTYYVREAPAARQTKTLTGWTLSDKVLTVTASAGATSYTSAGSITNAGPVSLSIAKNIVPDSDATATNLQNWRFELYSTEAAAKAGGTGYLKSAYTNTSGVATFSGLTADTTYYIREAPASRQDKKTNLDKWSLSSEILSGFAAAGSTSVVSVGSVTNYSGGNLSVTKTVSTQGDFANDKADWKFELYETEANAKAGTNYISSAYTNANGIAKFEGLIHGKTYYIKEAPLNRQDKRSSTSGWILSSTVHSGTVNAGTTIEVGSVENTAPGSLSITKNIKTAGDFTADKNNWRFELYLTREKAESGTGYIDFAYTNSNGIATFNNLTNGRTYYVREAPVSRQDRWSTTGWGLSSEIKSVTVVAGTVVSTGSIKNNAPAEITGIKSVLSESGTSGKLNGWIYQIASDRNFANIISTVTSDARGAWSTGFVLSAGTYYVREAPIEIQTRSDKNNFVLDNSIVTITVDAGESGEAYKENQRYTSQNIEKGKIQVKKDVFGIAANSTTLNNWVFNIYSDVNCTSLVTSIKTGTDGLGISALLAPKTYWIKEASQEDQIRSDISMWAISEDIVPVTVRAGATVNAYEGNGSTVTNFYGKYIRLTKTSNNVQNPDCYNQIKDNAMYTLAGAKYQIVVDGVVQETITTDETGVVISDKIYTVGTSGIIKETVAPDGYLLDTREYRFTIEATTDEYCEVKVSDIPVFDPNIQQFQKVDPETGVAQGNTSFEGAIFRWDYYDNTNWRGNPVRTWYFKTNANGLYGYHADYLANEYANDELYFSTNNIPQLPLGSVKITEISAPLGYKILPELYATITQPSMGGQADWDYTPETLAILKDLGSGLYSGEEPENLETLGSITIQKLDKDHGSTPINWATLEGCEFTIYNKSANPVKVGDYAIAQPNEPCYVLVVDANGQANADCIFPIGTYEVKETKGNDFYQCNGEWSQTFSIDGSNINPNFDIECENTMIPATINLQKINTLNEPLSGSKFLLEYSIDGQTDWAPVFKSNDIVIGGCSSEALNDEGYIEVGDDGNIAFEGLYPVVYYRITEIETPNGYQLLKDAIIVDSRTELTPDNNFETGYRVVNNESFAMPKTGAYDFWMLMPCFFIASLTMFCATYVATSPEKKKCKNR